MSTSSTSPIHSSPVRNSKVRDSKLYDFAIIGGGIVGLSTAMTLAKRYPEATVLVLEKESSLAAHQTGNNSGVIHSGIYYKPGSAKARLCHEGARSMVDFCQTHKIAHEVCGKVIVATQQDQLPRIETLYERGIANGVPVQKLTADAVLEIEPHVSCIAGLHVESTGIANYRQVCDKYAEILCAKGGEIYLNTKVTGLEQQAGNQIIHTDKGDFQSRWLVNCGGLFSDRIAKQTGIDPQVKIVPFRGEYYELIPEKRHLVKGLIYPVPDPAFPFLGVHFTRMIDGSVHAGPNAVLSFKREGYQKTDVDLKDLADVLTYPGFWKLAAKYGTQGLQEMARSLSKTLFVRSLQQLIPEVQPQDVIPTHAGVRAQALFRDGELADDFFIIHDQNAIHVCNAPSPAATASLEIGKAIADQLPVPVAA